MGDIDHEAISLRQSVKIRSDSIAYLSEQQETTAEKNVLLKSAPFFKFVLTGGPCGGLVDLKLQLSYCSCSIAAFIILFGFCCLTATIDLNCCFAYSWSRVFYFLPFFSLSFCFKFLKSKTTALARLSSFFRERGYETFTVPEAFTILASNGFSMDYFAVHGMPNCVQNTVMDMQMALEDSFERVLRAKGRPAILLCDRGLMDGSAYMSAEDWENFLQKRNINSADIREGRYNAVFHLVTAAEGAERFYTLDNNDARTETPEEARRVDHLSRTAWLGHPKHFVIDNKTDFEGKMNKLVNIASRLVGLPSTSKSVTIKYLLKEEPVLNSFPDDVQYSVFEVEKVSTRYIMSFTKLYDHHTAYDTLYHVP